MMAVLGASVGGMFSSVFGLNLQGARRAAGKVLHTVLVGGILDTLHPLISVGLAVEPVVGGVDRRGLAGV